MDHPLTAWQQQTSKVAQWLFMLFAFCIPVSLALENIGFGLALIAALASGLWWTYRQKIFVNKFALLLGLLIILFIIGIFYSPSVMWWRLKAFKKESEIISILFLLAIIPYERKFLFSVLRAYVYGALLVALIAWFGQFDWLPHIDWFSHPAPYYAFFKIYAGMFMAFAAYLSLVLAKQLWHSPSKWWWVLCFIVISYNVLWQNLSRTAYILYFMLLVLFTLQNFRFKTNLLGLLLIAVLGIATLWSSSNLHQGLAAIYQNSQAIQQGNLHTSTGVRFGYLKNTLQLFEQKPLFGHGTGGYRTADVQIHGINFIGVPATEKAPQVTPENTFYRILAEHGLVGIIVFLLLWGWQVVAAVKMSDPLYRQLALNLMLVMMVGSMSQDLLLDESPRLFYILFSALLYAPVLLKKFSVVNSGRYS